MLTIGDFNTFWFFWGALCKIFTLFFSSISMLRHSTIPHWKPNCRIKRPISHIIREGMVKLKSIRFSFIQIKYEKKRIRLW